MANLLAVITANNHMQTLIAMPRTSFLVAALGLVAGIGGERAANAPRAPKISYACYVPLTGTVYRIKESDVSQTCVAASHVEFSWVDGGNTCRVTGDTAGSRTGVLYSTTLARLFRRPLGTTEPMVNLCPPTGHATREADAASSPEL